MDSSESFERAQFLLHCNRSQHTPLRRTRIPGKAHLFSKLNQLGGESVPPHCFAVKHRVAESVTDIASPRAFSANPD
jgi:hypothetical protein